MIPLISAVTSFKPPTEDSLAEVTSTFQPRVSAKRAYMRNTSAANRVASSPPVPARISSTTFFSSFGSLGSSRTFSSSSICAICGSSFATSSWAIARSSGSDSASMGRASCQIAGVADFHSRYLPTISARSLCVLATLRYCAESLMTAGSAIWAVSSSNGARSRRVFADIAWGVLQAMISSPPCLASSAIAPSSA